MGGAVFTNKPEAHLPESRVLVIMTGGTICMQPSEDGLIPMNGFLEHAMAPRPSFNDHSGPSVKITAYKNGIKLSLDSLRTPPSAYSRHIRYGILEFSPLLDSSSISCMGWTEIAQTISENYHIFDGFVVLHGTDSLAYTASALSFMMSDLGKPVILTGSQASIFALQSDAVDNLLGSLIIAGTFVVPEVCLFFHHTLFRGNRTTKVSASSFEAFDSPNCAPLAKVTSLGVDVNWSLVRRPTRIAEFAVTKYLDTAHVACLRIFPGIKPEMVDSVLRVPNLRGLILETFGMGNAPGGVDGSLTKVIREAVERGIVIVNVSQCTNGFVSPLYAPGTALGRAGVVFGHDLTTEAALTKLSYLLALPGLQYTDVTARMAHSLRGEMTEMTLPSFSHPAGTIDSAVGRLTSAGTHPPFPSNPVVDPLSLSPSQPQQQQQVQEEQVQHQPHHQEEANQQNTTNILTPTPETAFTALGYAIRAGDLRTVGEILAGDEFSHRLLKRADYAGNTALHLAAVGPEPRVLRDLLTRGASVHARNAADNTPLYLAERVGNAEGVRLLREAGARLWVHGEGGNGNGTGHGHGNGNGHGSGVGASNGNAGTSHGVEGRSNGLNGKGAAGVGEGGRGEPGKGADVPSLPSASVELESSVTGGGEGCEAAAEKGKAETVGGVGPGDGGAVGGGSGGSGAGLDQAGSPRLLSTDVLGKIVG